MADVQEPVTPKKSTTNRKIFLLLSVLVAVWCVWMFILKTTEYYNGIESGTIDFSQIASNETSNITNASSNTNITTVANPRLVNFADDPSIGDKSAPVQIVMFADFECPFCRKVFVEIKNMLAKYGKDVYFVYRDFPITDLHPGAALAAEAANCAHAQGKFWQYHDKLFLAGSTNTTETLKTFARQINLDTAQFDSCLDNNFYADEVEDDYNDALALGVTGTPTFFFNGNRVAGVVTSAGFEQIIQYFKNY
ncbi:MAG: DsbA family protein [Candidatus Kerfeldbacteria bacterium]|nr:DsbA family protein [Candidatus Kerfeldbacteria bacterium]